MTLRTHETGRKQRMDGTGIESRHKIRVSRSESPKTCITRHVSFNSKINAGRERSTACLSLRKCQYWGLLNHHHVYTLFHSSGVVAGHSQKTFHCETSWMHAMNRGAKVGPKRSPNCSFSNLFRFFSTLGRKLRRWQLAKKKYERSGIEFLEVKVCRRVNKKRSKFNCEEREAKAMKGNWKLTLFVNLWRHLERDCDEHKGT